MSSFKNWLIKLFVLFPGMTLNEFKAMFNFKTRGKANFTRLTTYEQNRLYFCSGGTKINVTAVIVWIIVGIVIMSSTSFNGVAIGFGVLIICIDLFFLVIGSLSSPKITKKDVITNINNRIIELKQEGLIANGIDESQVNIAGDPLCISQYLLYDLSYKHYEREGISSNIAVTYFYVGIDQFYVFNSKLSIINEGEHIDESNDFFYKDIISTNIKTDSSTPGKFILELSLCNAQRISYEFFGSTETNQTLIALKNLIRDKRNN